MFLTSTLICARLAMAQGDLLQIRDDFTTDPGWEGVNNRVVATDSPTITQDFGYRSTSHAGARSGEIGGVIWSSVTPASYGMKVGPFTYADAVSASGRICIRRAPGRSGVYIGFFNSTRQGWRPWSSLMIQLSGSKRGQIALEGGAAGAQAWFTTVAESWQSTGMVSDFVIPADGSVHQWSFHYDPNARIDLAWRHPDLERCFRDSRMSEESLYEKAKTLDPKLSRTELRRRLDAATEQGLLIYDPRRGTDFWERQANAAQFRGCVTLQIDGRPPRRMYLPPGLLDQPLGLDRFGIVNHQTYGRDMEFYLADLTVNGHKIDLSSDPGWEGRGNQVSYREREFHGRQDFGFRETNWAGVAPGEIGGIFWRTEPNDPLHGYYAADVGTITLDDPISFSGKVSFVEGQPDSGVCFGYFNHEDALVEIAGESGGSPLNQSLGIVVEGPTRIGYYFTAFSAPTRETAKHRDGPVFVPTRQKHAFSFVYDPAANRGAGRVTVALDTTEFSLNLTPQQRKAGARFDRFGLWNIRQGGKFVEIYLDDLTYTARLPKGERPVKKKPKVVEVPYPEGGRKY